MSTHYARIQSHQLQLPKRLDWAEAHLDESSRDNSHNDGLSVPIIGEQITTLVRDASLQPEQKALAVYTHCRQLIQNLFEQPSAQFLYESKKAIGSVVDMILSDEERAHSLLTVTQYDYSTYTHSVNVGVYCISLAKRLYGEASGHNMQELGAGFFLHDIGKTCIDHAIINKNGRLTRRETAIVKNHPYYSFTILNEANHATKECALIALQHHEREDGTGYPDGRKGSGIHDYARICSIGDVFDALVSMRPYKDPFTPLQALETMRDEMIGHFHKELLANFIRLFDNRHTAACPVLRKAA